MPKPVAAPKLLTPSKRFFIGGLGALTPIVLNLLIVDVSALLSDFSKGAALGYGVRVAVLFYIGGLVAYLHSDEKKPFKLFELGVVAPALLTALLNGKNAAQTQRPEPVRLISGSVTYPSVVVSSGAKTEAPAPDWSSHGLGFVGTGSTALSAWQPGGKATASRQFLKGLTGDWDARENFYPG